VLSVLVPHLHALPALHLHGVLARPPPRPVRQAQQRSVQERQPYLIVWQKDSIILRPESLAQGENAAPDDTIALDKYHSFSLRLPAALEKNPLPQWIFWPSGTCEPADVSFQGSDGAWEVNYSPLTARPQIVRYAAK